MIKQLFINYWKVIIHYLSMIILNSLLINCYELIKIDPTVQLQRKE